MNAAVHRFAAELGERAPGLELVWTTDRKGASAARCRLPGPALLLPLAEAVAHAGGRLAHLGCTSGSGGGGLRPPTGRGRSPSNSRLAALGRREVVYAFDLAGAALCATLELPAASEGLPSLAALFANAAWAEREAAALHGLEVTGAPRPGERSCPGEAAGADGAWTLVPYSDFTNGASSRTLWEHVLAAREKEDRS